MLIEGIGPLGLPAVTISVDILNRWPEGFERALFDTAHVFYYRDGGFKVWNPPPDVYLRMLANRSTPAVDYRFVDEAERPDYRAANLAYSEAIKFMDHSLPDPHPGLRAWQSQDEQTLILFHLGMEPARWPTDRVARVTNLSTQKSVEVTDGHYKLQPQHVYRLDSQ